MGRTDDKTRYYRSITLALLIPLLLSGCMTYSGTRRGYMERLTEYLPAPQRPVIVIPGFGNSRLYDPVEDKLVWGLGKNLVHTKYSDDLDLPVDPTTGEFGTDRLKPDGSFAGSRAPFNIAFTLSKALRDYGGYDEPGEAWSAVGTVHTFAYDWRLSAVTNARRLDEFIDSIRAAEQPAAPKVDLVAHSAGGIVALTYLKLGGLEPDADEHEIARASAIASSKVSSVTLIGVPQHGTNEAVRALARGEKLIRREMTPKMMSSFSSVLEMLPSDGTVFIDEQGRELPYNVWAESMWRDLGFAVWADDPDPELIDAFETSLRKARQLREILAKPLSSGVRETVIVGDCVPTASRILLRSDRSLAFYASELQEGEESLARRMFVPGDGSIEARSAMAESESDLIVCAGHHSMASDPNVHRALIRGLLQEGNDRTFEARASTRQGETSSMESPNPR
jgi:pimeloyl-ACP methyl ester carboxylesterase